jgi:hypothetical protein
VTDMEMDARTRAALGEAGESGDPEVDELVGEIVETREEMTVTVEEIGDRLDPRNIVAGAKETVREATVGKVEDMANTAGALVSDAGDTVREAGSGIVDTITRNPIPAAMVGLGLGWLALSRRPASPSRYGRQDWRPAYGDPMYGGHTGSDRSAVDKVQQRAGEMAGQVGRKVDDVTGQVGRVADELPYQVRTTADQIGTEAGRLFQSNPLAFGAIAAAVGTAVGLAMPATQMERRAIGTPARQVLQRAEEAATEAIEGVEQTARDAEQQAREQDSKTRAH